MEAVEEFKRGDELAAAGDKVALEYGWWAETWIRSEAHRAGEKGGIVIGVKQERAVVSQATHYPDSRADPNSRAAFTYALTILDKHHGKYLSHAQITDRIRIGRAFPANDYKDLVEELHYTFSFSQLRAAYVRDDQEATMALLLWAAEHDASPMEIYARKMGSEVESAEAKAWRHMVEWAYKYAERCENRDGLRLERARAVIDQDREERAAP